jgi:menaquinone-dependent protoporphyrinogen oxidase
MNRRILVAYATKHGSTLEVAEAIAVALRDRGREVDVGPAADQLRVLSLSARSGKRQR